MLIKGERFCTVLTGKIKKADQDLNYYMKVLNYFKIATFFFWAPLQLIY